MISIRPLTSDSILMTAEVVLVITEKPERFRLDATFPATDQTFLCTTVSVYTPLQNRLKKNSYCDLLPLCVTQI